ncbi:MAG: protein kinase [Polyangiaceae bacterium]
MEPIAPVSVGDIVVDKYRIDRILGVGGMGYVVAATHVQIDQRVAIKFVKPNVQPGSGDSSVRLLREARSAAKLQSEHVTRVYDMGQLPPGHPQAGTSFIVMELVEGRDLSKVMEENPRGLPVPDAVEYALQICAALVEAHAAGIVHRDLKPQNLVLSRRLQGTPLVKVLDFGIAKDTSGLGDEAKSLTDSSVVLGSPLYMSPEQMRGGREVSPRTDLWAVGVILHQFLSGSLPFDAPTVPELCVKVLTLDPPPLEEVAPHVPPALAAIVRRCLEKEPQLRFASAAELAMHLEPFSRSAERGMMDRPWRSMAETLDSGANDPAGLVSVPSPSHPSHGVRAGGGTTGFVNVSLSHAPTPEPKRFKKRTFFFGATLGAAIVSVLVVALSTQTSSTRPSAIRLPEQGAARGLAAGSPPLAATDPAPASSASNVADPSKGRPVVGLVPGVSSAFKPRTPGGESTAPDVKPTATPVVSATPSSTPTVRVGANGAPIL